MSTSPAEQTYTEACQLLNAARKALYQLEKYPVDESVWASIRGHIGGCSDVARCHMPQEVN